MGISTCGKSTTLRIGTSAMTSSASAIDSPGWWSMGSRRLRRSRVGRTQATGLVDLPSRATRERPQAFHVGDLDLAVVDLYQAPARQSGERATHRLVRHAQVAGDVTAVHAQ